MSFVVAQPVRGNLKDLGEYFEKKAKERQKIKSPSNYRQEMFCRSSCKMDELKRIKTFSKRSK